VSLSDRCEPLGVRVFQLISDLKLPFVGVVDIWSYMDGILPAEWLVNDMTFCC
jgi:hypothetical protein